MCGANKLERFVHSKPDLIFFTKIRGKCKVLHMDIRLGLKTLQASSVVTSKQVLQHWLQAWSSMFYLARSKA